MEKIIIEQDSLYDDFNDHILLPQNHRILFTAPFGTGKTTFLKEFFDKYENIYITIDLYPIQYSVSQNEDVFELIKFDILLQLIGKYEDELNLQKEDFSLLLTSQVYIQEHLNVMPLLYAILSISQKIGKPASALIKALQGTVGDLKKYQKDIQIDEELGIEAILKSIEDQKGSAYEMDNVSNLICDLVKRVKNYKDKSEENLSSGKGSSPKESVLIIDDLDRLDPEHIFRLFNVFSSQFNIMDDGNKFEFDKIIFVCDIDNIRRIYRHKYGPGVDFQGYIDKFYSLNAFDFDNKEFVKRRIDEMLKSFSFSSSGNSRIFSHILKKDDNHGLYYVMRWVFLSLIDSGNMNLRMLLHPPIKIIIPDSLFQYNNRELRIQDYHILGAFYTLKAFYGSFNLVGEKLNDLKGNYGKGKIQKAHFAESFSWSKIDTFIFSLCLPFLLPSAIDHLVNQPIEDETSYSAELKCSVNYSINRSSGMNPNNEFKFKKFIDSDGEKELEFSTYEILYITFDKCLKNGYLSE